MAVDTYPVNVTLYHGTYIDLSCTVTASEYVDTNTSITTSWTGSTGLITNNTLYIVTTSTSSGYVTRLRIQSLDLERDNGAAYSCVTSIEPSPQNGFVLASRTNNTLTLDVRGQSMFEVLYNWFFLYQISLLTSPK